MQNINFYFKLLIRLENISNKVLFTFGNFFFLI